MPISFDKPNQRWRYQFDRVIPGKGRQRASRLLPKGWSRTQADTFDRKESARLYALATGVESESKLIDDAVLIYLQERGPQLKNFRSLQDELSRCFEAYSGRSITDLPDVAREYVQRYAKDLAPGTIRNRIAYLRAACRYAWKHHGFCDRDPASRLVMPKVKNERNVYLTRAQMLRIARLIRNRQARAAARIAFYSGMRLGEICRAVVIDGEFTLQDTKNGSQRHVPVMAQIAHIVRNPDLWPIKITGWAISHHFTWATRAAGTPQATFHTLRHSNASAMINAGVDLHSVGKVLGHKSHASTDRYAHRETASLRRALETVGRKSSHSQHPKAA